MLRRLGGCGQLRLVNEKKPLLETVTSTSTNATQIDLTLLAREREAAQDKDREVHNAAAACMRESLTKSKCHYFTWSD